MKLNIGCGSYYKKGYVNIDSHTIDLKVDRAFDCNKPLDYPHESIEEILAIHSLEHLKRKTLKRAVGSWYRCLKPGGKLIIETPDLLALCNKYNESSVLNDFLEMHDLKFWFFGNQERKGQTHYWGWCPWTLKVFLEQFGFSKILTLEPKNDSRPKELSFRIEAVK